ncbi:MAG: hypothetical protein WCD18_22625 [Thermosynechococcaceae cyanobacterium]
MADQTKAIAAQAWDSGRRSHGDRWKKDDRIINGGYSDFAGLVAA